MIPVTPLSLSRRPSRDRRGSQVVEFALVLPILCTMVLGLIDYGWFFLQQSMVTNSIREAMRYGAIQTPATTDLAGDCSTCVDGAATEIVSQLAVYGIVVAAVDVTPTIVNIAGTCALQLTPTIPFEPVAGFVPTPDLFDVNAVTFLQNVTGC